MNAVVVAAVAAAVAVAAAAVDAAVAVVAVAKDLSHIVLVVNLRAKMRKTKIKLNENIIELSYTYFNKTCQCFFI